MTKKTLFGSLAGASLVIAATLWPSPAGAQVRPEPVQPANCAPSPFVYDDDPFWGPGPYPYSAAYLNGQCLSASVRVLATPVEANVYVDGFYAGLVDDFDGALQRLPVTPGDHAITLYLEGYGTVTKHVVASPDSPSQLQLTMDKLGPDDVSEPPPQAVRPIEPGPHRHD
jgi:PEGA domain